MRGTAHDGVLDWLQFRAPDKDGDDTEWNVNLTFLLSGWQCIFGQGCPGHFGKQERYVAPDIACCSDGFYVRDEEDHANVLRRVAQLTPVDWDEKNRAYVERKGGWEIKRGDDTKSRVMEGGCVFANRTGGSTGKPGCAFVALANRLGENVDDSTVDGHDSHTKYMPTVCHEVPLHFEWVEGHGDHEEPRDNYNICTIDAWDSYSWTRQPQDNGDWMSWWCVDSPDAYINAVPLYMRMKDTIVAHMGEATFQVMHELIERKQPKVDPMPGVVLNDGRPLLPLLLGGRLPVREDPEFLQHIENMKEQ